MTALEAKQLANLKAKPSYDFLVKNKINNINDLIKLAANRGRFSITYNEYLGKGIISHFEQLGFTVKHGDNLMAMESINSVEISWN